MKKSAFLDSDGNLCTFFCAKFPFLPAPIESRNKSGGNIVAE